jgi:hypothetical protein
VIIQLVICHARLKNWLISTAQAAIELLVARQAIYQLPEGPDITQKNKIENQRARDVLELSKKHQTVFFNSTEALSETKV